MVAHVQGKISQRELLRQVEKGCFSITGLALKVVRTHDRKRADERCIDIIHAPYTTPDDIARRFPAHIHIDILPSHQVCTLPKVSCQDLSHHEISCIA
jgi:hypothetical protein